MSSQPIIRAENPSDAAAVGRVLLSAFPSAGEANLVDNLRSAGRLEVSLVAEVRAEVVGHIFGFQTASRSGLRNEYGVDQPFMVLELAPGSLSACRGRVRYCLEFASMR